MFTESIIFQAPPGFSSALLEVARRNHMTKSEYLRRCALERMEREGVRVPVKLDTVSNSAAADECRGGK